MAPEKSRHDAEAAWRMDHAMRRIVSVSKDELERREAAYQKTRQNKPRPGPKPASRS